MNKDCVARIYLGRRRCSDALLSPNFSLRNFNFCLDQMLDLGLPIKHYARAMAECPAIVHWEAHIDGYDIEFVLGSEAEISYTIHVTQSLGLDVEELEKLPKYSDMEILDFNLYNRFPNDVAFLLKNEEELIQHLVIAFLRMTTIILYPLWSWILIKNPGLFQIRV
ncbi:hypothetical protein B0T26DRAFT_764406 [Lasiosphaeria miniovina]|uniref:Uncharacterized protein n=1 Tax=Lasiosphaeria miniovina TaxID=1954250 RepID=A0AA40B3E2_9PEZI|nr:uncharacterized protein B0T26DRAFT_764406 [Lasiosphaeria miniovina]KAK0726971.1 hypothetical protein B0T26DRAFT_764406 [Lasiosphaeria miniovina]